MVEESPTATARSFSLRFRVRGEVWTTIRDYWVLTKPEINALVLLTTVAGFGLECFGKPGPFLLPKLLGVIVGTLLITSGAGALNQVIERRFDSQMRRTMRRPVPAGKLDPGRAGCFGVMLALAGALWLFAFANRQSALLGVLALLIYLFLYTPLKRKTAFCTLAGAMVGAIPPLIGWFAAGGNFTGQAAALCAFLFLWQFPHFMAIAWIYKEDYERAGYRVIPMGSRQKNWLTVWTIGPCLALLLLIVMPTVASGEAVFLPVSCLIGCGLLLYGVRFVIRKTKSSARELLTASILYVPLALALLIVVERYRLLLH
jgi:protoheme IX farnesyltransferase